MAGDAAGAAGVGAPADVADTAAAGTLALGRVPTIKLRRAYQVPPLGSEQEQELGSGSGRELGRGAEQQQLGGSCA